MGCGLRRKPVAVSQAICQDPHVRWPQWMYRSMPLWCCGVVMTSGAVAKACNTSTAAVAVFLVRSASPQPCPSPMSLSSPCRPFPLPLLPIPARVPACVPLPPPIPLSLCLCLRLRLPHFYTCPRLVVPATPLTQSPLFEVVRMAWVLVRCDSRPPS